MIQKIDSSVKQHSYINMMKKQNKTKFGQTMNGMQNVSNLCFLQVNGVNQLEKEINETKDILSKIIDLKAIHRNEVTNEMECYEMKR